MDFIELGRISIEQAAGGNGSWTAGVDFARLLARSPYAPQVRALYRQAGLPLGADLATLTAGADNLFDVYPDQNNDVGDPRAGTLSAAAGPNGRSGNANFGIFPYNQFSPFGFNGRYVYARVALSW